MSDGPDQDPDNLLALPAFSTFLGAPSCAPSAAAVRAAGAQAAFFGAPVETQVFPVRPGTTLGPKACREASQQFLGCPTVEYGYDVAERWTLVDCGDASLRVGDIHRFHDRIREVAAEILAAGALPIMVGGDHSIPIPGVEALVAARPGARIGYLQIDAHVDTADTVEGERRTMASPVRRAVEHAEIAPENVAVVGVRGPANSREMLDAARDLRIGVFPMTDVFARGVDAVIEDALDRVFDGTDAVYVSFDHDSMDPSHAPGITAPEPFGFTSREMYAMATRIGARGPAMLDLAELSPLHDPAGITARLTCYWIIYVLSAYARALDDGGLSR